MNQSYDSSANLWVTTGFVMQNKLGESHIHLWTSLTLRSL